MASWEPNSGPLWNHAKYHSSIVLRGLRRAIHWASIMPRDASLSDSKFDILQLTHRNIFAILLNQTEIWFYLQFSDSFGTKRTFFWFLPLCDYFGTKRTSVCFQINRKMVNTIWFRFDLIRMRKDLVPNQSVHGKYNLIQVWFNTNTNLYRRKNVLT